MLAASPLAKGLFHGAISESGGNFGRSGTATKAARTWIRWPRPRRTAWLSWPSSVLFNRRCAHQIRGGDPEKLRLPASGGSWPIFDGYVLLGDQYKLYEAGRYNDTAVLIGTNSDEGALFVPPSQPRRIKSSPRRLRRIRGQDSRRLSRRIRMPKRCVRRAICSATPPLPGLPGPGRDCNRKPARAKRTFTISATVRHIPTRRSSRIGARPMPARSPMSLAISGRRCPPRPVRSRGLGPGVLLLGELRQDRQSQWDGAAPLARFHQREWTSDEPGRSVKGHRRFRIWKNSSAGRLLRLAPRSSGEETLSLSGSLQK